MNTQDHEHKNVNKEEKYKEYIYINNFINILNIKNRLGNLKV